MALLPAAAPGGPFAHALRQAAEALLLVALLAPFVSSSVAAGAISEEFKARGAFLNGIAKAVDWPEASAPAAGQDVRLGVYGNRAFAESLGSMLAGKGFAVRAFSSPRDLEWCHVLWIDRAADDDVGGILASIKGHPVLTTGNITGFLARGGMVQFCIVDGSPRFDVRQATLKAAGLEIDSHVLELSQTCE